MNVFICAPDGRYLTGYKRDSVMGKIAIWTLFRDRACRFDCIADAKEFARDTVDMHVRFEAVR